MSFFYAAVSKGNPVRVELDEHQSLTLSNAALALPTGTASLKIAIDGERPPPLVLCNLSQSIPQCCLDITLPRSTIATFSIDGSAPEVHVVGLKQVVESDSDVVLTSSDDDDDEGEDEESDEETEINPKQRTAVFPPASASTPASAAAAADAEADEDEELSKLPQKQADWMLRRMQDASNTDAAAAAGGSPAGKKGAPPGVPPMAAAQQSAPPSSGRGGGSRRGGRGDGSGGKGDAGSGGASGAPPRKRAKPSFAEK